MAKNDSKRGLDEQLLEGGGGGGGTRSTKWSNMPSLRGNANVMDDFRKLTAPPTKAKGAAKRSVEMAEDRAINRMAVRAAGAAGAGAAAKSMIGKDAVANEKSKDSEDYEDTTGNAVRTNDPVGAAGTGMKKGGSVSSASKRADGCCTKGKTKGRFV